MSDCPCCWEGDEEEAPPPTPEEIAAFRAREEARLSDRMRPARDWSEQMERDLQAHIELAAAQVERALYAPVTPLTVGMSGLSAWLP